MKKLKYFREAARSRYLPSAKETEYFHSLLADFFLGKLFFIFIRSRSCEIKHNIIYNLFKGIVSSNGLNFC
jgi:hypothetical protein